MDEVIKKNAEYVEALENKSKQLGQFEDMKLDTDKQIEKRFELKKKVEESNKDLKELEGEFLNLVEKEKNNAAMSAYEKRIKEIHDTHKAKLDERIRLCTEKLNTNISKENKAKIIMSLSENHIQLELFLRDKIDYLASQVEVEEQRCKALSIMHSIDRKSNRSKIVKIEDRLAEDQRRFERKTTILDDENENLRLELSRLQDEIDDHYIEVMSRNDPEEISEVSQLSKNYSHINSMIESLSVSSSIGNDF